MVLSSDFQINVISCRVCLFVVVVALCGQYALSMHVITGEDSGNWPET